MRLQPALQQTVRAGLLVWDDPAFDRTKKFAAPAVQVAADHTDGWVRRGGRLVGGRAAPIKAAW